MGTILPIEVGKLFGPPPKKGTESVAGAQMARAGGAVFGTAFNIFKAMQDVESGALDPKRWERAVPRSLGNLSAAMRIAYEGGDRNKSGAMTVKYDIHDNEHVAELVGRAMGYQNLRTQVKWDEIIMQTELSSFMDMQRNMLLRQMFEARRSGSTRDVESVESQIKKFNQGLPEWAVGRAITAETIKRSMSSRERIRKDQEAGVPSQKSKQGTADEISRLHPEARVLEERRIRRQRSQ
jgi:hypothetical protein